MVPARTKGRHAIRHKHLMNRPDWQKVKHLFAQALEQPDELRLDFLRQQCGDDELLFSEVDSLLAASGEADNLIESNAIDLASKLRADDGDHTDRLFGNYRILRE